MKDVLSRKVVFDVSYATFLKVVLIILLFLFLYAVREILLLMCVAIILASGLDPLIDWLQKKKIPRAVSSLFLFLILIGVIAMVVYLLVPPLIDQIQQLIDVLPGYMENLFEKVAELTGYSQEQSMEKAREIVDSLDDRIGSAASSIYGWAASVFGGFVSVVIIFVLAFYFIVEENSFKKFIRSLVPTRHRPYADDLVGRVQKKIGKWLRGQLFLGLVVGVFVFIGLSLLGVEYALVLAILAALLELVPYIGPIVAAIPAVLIAFTQSPVLALIVIALYFVIQQLENHILVPKIMQRVVGLNPLVIILVILVAVQLAGILGAIVAIPVATAISVFLKDLFEERDKKDKEKLEKEICKSGEVDVEDVRKEDVGNLQKRVCKVPPQKKKIDRG